MKIRPKSVSTHQQRPSKTASKHKEPRQTVDLLSPKDVRDGLRSTLEATGSSGRLKALLRQQGKVKDRKQDRLANAAFETVLEPEASPEEISRVFNLLEEALSDPKVRIVDSKKLGGGVNTTKLIRLSNGLRGVWKPNDEAYGRKLRKNIPLGQEDGRDRAAYLMDKRMGHAARIPPTVLREFDGKEGVLSFFVGNAETAGVSHQKAGEVLFDPVNTGTSPIAVLDNVVGNVDRHSGNWMIARTGQAVPIDHGLSFPYRNGSQGRCNTAFGRELKLAPETGEKLRGLLENRTEITAELEEVLDSKPVKAMFRRIEGILEDGETSVSWLGDSQTNKASATRFGYTKDHNYELTQVRGLSSKARRALQKDGIEDTKQLLAEFGHKKDRNKLFRNPKKGLAKAFTPDSLLDALNKADLMRMEGVGGTYAELLHHSGVDSIVELATRNPKTLADTLKEINQDLRVGERAPGSSEVGEWVRKAKLMDRKVKH